MNTGEIKPPLCEGRWLRRDGTFVTLTRDADGESYWGEWDAGFKPQYWPTRYRDGAYCNGDVPTKYDLISPIAYPANATTPAFVTKDSGQREEMASGSVRDSREGKGRFELISPFALARIAGVYERGAKKYASRNWEKGQPFSRFLDSALRHLNRFAMGWTDEDHLSQAAWNILAIIHFQELGKTDLDDMPHYQSGPPHEQRPGECPSEWARRLAGGGSVRGGGTV